MRDSRRVRRAEARTILLGLAVLAASLFEAAGVRAADPTAAQPLTETIVAGAVAAKPLTFRPAFVLDSHPPSGPVTNTYGGPEVEQNASAASNGAGQWVAVWHSSDSFGGRTGRDYDILVSRSTDGGLTWSERVPLNTNASSDVGDDLEPLVATDKAGVWLAVWSSSETFGGQYGLDRDIFFSRSTDNGATWSAPAPLNLNAAQDWGKDEEPRLAADAAGNWLVVWSSTDTLGNRLGGDSDILVSRSSDKGQTWTYPVALNNNAASDHGFDSAPDIMTDGSNRWLAAWSSGDSGLGGIGNDRDILVARSDDDGATWSNPSPLNSNAASDRNADWTPRLATDGRGHWLGVWSSADSLGDSIGVDRDILLARSGDNGNTWSTVRALNRNAASDASEDSSPAIVFDGLGNWIVAWHTWGDLGDNAGSDADVVVVYSADAGVSWTEPVHISDRAAGDAVDDMIPALAADGRGECVAVWQSFNPPDLEAKDSEWRILAASTRMSASAANPPSSAAAAGPAKQ